MALPANRLKRPGRATLQEVAELAGVSAMSASRALTTPAKVSAALRERVLAASQQLGYVANRAASTLASSRSRLVLIVLPGQEDPAIALLRTALEDTLAALGYASMALRLPALDPSAPTPVTDSAAATLSPYLAHGPDAIVFTGLEPDPSLLPLLQRLDLPWTQACAAGDASGRPGAGASPRTLGSIAIGHLLERDRHRLGILCAAGEAGAQARAHAAQQAWLASGRRAATLVCADQVPSPQLGETLAARLLALAPDCDALFLTHDLLALGALAVCRARGLAVPQRLALLGVHDLDFGPWLAPPLSSIDTRRHRTGEQAARELIERVEGPARKACWFDTGCELRARGSS